MILMFDFGNIRTVWYVLFLIRSYTWTANFTIEIVSNVTSYILCGFLLFFFILIQFGCITLLIVSLSTLYPLRFFSRYVCWRC